MFVVVAITIYVHAKKNLFYAYQNFVYYLITFTTIMLCHKAKLRSRVWMTQKNLD